MILRDLHNFLFGTLRGRLILSVAAVHAVMMTLFIFDLTLRQRDMVLENQKAAAMALSESLATSAAGWIAADDLSGLQELVEAQRRYPEIRFAMLTDNHGRILASIDRSKVGLYLSDLPTKKQDTILSESTELVDVATPATLDNKYVGWVRIGMGQKRVTQKLRAIVLVGALYALGAIAFGSVVAWSMGIRITKRLYTVQDTISRVKAGERSARSALTGNDEAASIAGEFNTMLDTLDERDKALRESEESYRVLLQRIRAAVVVHGPDTRILTSNATAQRLLGLTEEQLLGEAAVDPNWHFLREDGTIMPLEDYPANKVLSTRQPIRDLVAGIHRPGEEENVWVLVNADPVWDELGDLEQIIVSFVDITERKHAEQNLALMSAALNNVHEAAFLIDENARFHYVNEESCHILGYEHDELLRMGVPDVDPDFPLEQWHDHWNELKAKGSITFEGRHRAKDGYIFPVEISANYIEYAGHSYNLALVRDITERKKVGDTIKKSEAQLNEAQRIAHIGSWELDLVNNVLTWSDEIYRIFAIDPKKFGASYEAFLNAIHPDDREAVNFAYTNSLTTRTPYEITHRLLFANGQIKYVHEQCETIYDADGNPIRSLGTVQDITERVKDDEAMRRLNRELRAISNCNQVLIRAEDEQYLLSEICRIVCDEAGYRMAWVGYAENDEAKTVRPVAWAGFEEGYLAKANITWADTERGRGPTGTAIRTGESACIHDFTSDPFAAPWRENALQRGYRSSISLPLKDENEETFAALTIYSTEPSTFTYDEVRLLEELADDLAFGITVIRTRNERNQAESHKREFYRGTILAATEGKLLLTEKWEIDLIAGPAEAVFDLSAPFEVGDIRNAIAKIAHREGMDPSRADDFSIAIGEALTNALKHAGGGTASIHQTPRSLLFVISDNGTGIEAMTLPKVALERGYTTAGTLGMGYTIMISVADKVYLATGPEGTTVGIEFVIQSSLRELD